jgi:hypothetical protein
MHVPPRSRLSITLGVAAAIHLACGLFGYRLTKGEREMAERAVPPETEIDVVEVGDVGDVAAPSGVPHESEESPSSAALATNSLGRVRDRRGPPSVDGPPTASGEPEAAPSANQGGDYALDPSALAAPGTTAGPAISLGIGAGDWSRFVDPTAAPTHGPRRPSELPAPVSSTGGLAEALEARDQKLGLGPAGAVLSAVHDVGYSDIAPSIGVATFSITVLRSGAIDVQLTGSNGHAAEWAKVGEGIAAAIRRKPPRIASSRIGVRIGVEVVAEERWPNGNATRLDTGPHVTAQGPVFQGVDVAQQELLDRNPAAVPEPDAPIDKPKLQANFKAPGVFVEGRGKVCRYKVGLSPIPISGGCDWENVGQRARRVVSTRVINQTML